MAGLSESVERPAALPKIRNSHVIACIVGNTVEFYDFSTYAYFATQIGRTFFPLHSPIASLLASLAVFGVGFVGRPIGAVVIGRYGDRTKGQDDSSQTCDFHARLRVRKG